MFHYQMKLPLTNVCSDVDFACNMFELIIKGYEAGKKRFNLHSCDCIEKVMSVSLMKPLNPKDYIDYNVTNDHIIERNGKFKYCYPLSLLIKA